MGLDWREQLSVGNDLLDTDHKHLIGIINQVENCLAMEDWDELRKALDSLSLYSRAHFAAEEKIARAVGYPHVFSLHESHQALMDKLEQVKQELVKEWTPALVESFKTLLRSWLIQHVIKEDLLMKPYLIKWSPEFDPR